MGAAERRAQALKDIKSGAIRPLAPVAAAAPAPTKKKKKVSTAAHAVGDLPNKTGSGSAQPALECTQAVLQTVILFSGLQMQNINDVKVPGVKMLWVKGEGLLLMHNGNECIVPAANVAVAILKTHNNGRIQAD